MRSRGCQGGIGRGETALARTGKLGLGASKVDDCNGGSKSTAASQKAAKDGSETSETSETCKNNGSGHTGVGKMHAEILPAQASAHRQTRIGCCCGLSCPFFFSRLIYSIWSNALCCSKVRNPAQETVKIKTARMAPEQSNTNEKRERKKLYVQREGQLSGLAHPSAISKGDAQRTAGP